MVHNPSGVDFALAKNTQMLRIRTGSLPSPEGFLDFEFPSKYLFKLHHTETGSKYSLYLRIVIQVAELHVEEVLELPTPTNRDSNSRHQLSEGIEVGKAGIEYEWRTYGESSDPEPPSLGEVLREGLVGGDREVRLDIANRMDVS